MRRTSVWIAVAAALLMAVPVSASSPGDGPVNGTPPGMPTGPFSQNKQNEPAVAIDALNPNIVVAASNDEIDMEACNAGDPKTCPFTPGVGVSGVYFSSNSGRTWTQPTYSGLTARYCLGPAPCSPVVGNIGTLPWYYEDGLVADGDPALAFGPKPVNGAFSWSNGSRLYYANLTSNLAASRSEEAFKGFEAIAVSRTDRVAAAAAGDKSAWMHPVLVSKQSSTTFSDKEQIWADNAASSRFFGNVYICWASFRGQEKSLNAAPAPMIVAVSSDGGDTWTEHQVTAAANNGNVNPMDGCTVRTDSHGNAYVFGIAKAGGSSPAEFMTVSADGGKSWSPHTPVVGPVSQPGIFDPVLGRPTIDGIAGARSDLAPAPSVDIANGAPWGTDATDRIVMTYVSGEITKPHVYFTESTNQGETWSTPRTIEGASDRGLYTAPAISPDGKTVYVVYNAFTTPYRDNTKESRALVGVFMRATVGASGTGNFTEVHRGAPGDPRGTSQNNLRGEFLGDYVYAAATRNYGTAVWNDARKAADCSAIDDWRMWLRTGGPTVARPAPQVACAANFGNSDIYGITVSSP